jgi:hypothetical protein
VTARNEPALRRLVRVLTGGRFLTATQVAAETGCSRPVAYWRLAALKRRGVKFQTCRLRQGATGPKATAYAVVPTAASRALGA